MYGGERGIRTPDSLATMPDFESGAFNRALPALRMGKPLIANGFCSLTPGLSIIPKGVPPTCARQPFRMPLIQMRGVPT
jgi:hypothetical protein